MSVERKTLADAIARRASAELELTKAEQALEGARRYRASLQARVEAFHDLDSKIATERATAIKEALSKGAPPDLKPSEALASAVAARADAENQIAAAGGALSELEREASVARLALDTARESVLVAAEAVAAAEANALAEEIAVRERETFDLRIQLYGAGQLTRQSSAKVAAFLDRGEVSRINRETAATRAGVTNAPEWVRARDSAGAWRRFLDELATDPAATL